MVPLAGLPAASRSAGRLDAVIGAIAHQMGERILDQFEHLAVELGLGAVHFELDVLAELGAEIAHDARQFLPRIADRLHARLHHAFLQLGGDVGKPLQRHLEVGILVPADDLKKLVAGQHQLRNRGHQMIERIDVDADRMVGEPVAALRLPARRRARRRLWRQVRSPARRRMRFAGWRRHFARRRLRRRLRRRIFLPRQAAELDR